jgi:hypothetical protein
LAFVPSSIPMFFVNDPTLFVSLDDDSEDANTSTPTHFPLLGSIENEPTLAPLLPEWAHITWEAIGDVVSDPIG